MRFAVADQLVEIINLSFRTGIYIESLKISKVMPIFKEKGCELECFNQRPISLLSNIKKISMYLKITIWISKRPLNCPCTD